MFFDVMFSPYIPLKEPWIKTDMIWSRFYEGKPQREEKLNTKETKEENKSLDFFMLADGIH